MDYSVDRLTSVEECDSMLQIAQVAKDDFVYSKSTLEHRMASYEERSVKHETDLGAVTAELDSLNAIFDTLPDGEVKEDVESRIKRLEYRQWLLEERSDSYGVISLLEQQMDIAKIDAQIAEIDTFITAVEAHKTTL